MRTRKLTLGILGILAAITLSSCVAVRDNGFAAAAEGWGLDVERDEHQAVSIVIVAPEGQPLPAATVDHMIDPVSGRHLYLIEGK